MVTVTERAMVTLVRLKTVTGICDEVGLRLSLDAGYAQFGLRVDREKPSDLVVEHAGAKVLLVERTLAQALGNATIDTEPTGRGADLVISRIHPRRHGARQRAYMTLLLKK